MCFICTSVCSCEEFPMQPPTTDLLKFQDQTNCCLRGGVTLMLGF